MLKRFLSICTLFVIIAVGYFQKDVLLHFINDGGTVSIFISMLLVAICVFFPVIPFPVLAGVIGTIFGTYQAVCILLLGAMVGTMSFFFLSRYGFRSFAQDKLMKYPRIQKYEAILNRNSFVAILTFRMIPILPALVMNTICGLSRVNWLAFFAASAIGKIPNIIILSYVGALFNTNKFYSMGLYGIYILILFLIYFAIIYLKKPKSSIE